MSENNDNIPDGLIKSQYMTVIRLQIGNTNISTDAFQKSLFKFNKDLEGDKTILKRVNIRGYEKQVIELSLITSAFNKLNRDELKEAIKSFVKEYLNLPTVEVKSAKFDYLERIKSLQYFKDNYHFVEQEKEKDFKSMYKAKM